jgi:hypothetical protein
MKYTIHIKQTKLAASCPRCLIDSFKKEPSNFTCSSVSGFNILFSFSIEVSVFSNIKCDKNWEKIGSVICQYRVFMGPFLSITALFLWSLVHNISISVINRLAWLLYCTRCIIQYLASYVVLNLKTVGKQN